MLSDSLYHPMPQELNASILFPAGPRKKKKDVWSHDNTNAWTRAAVQVQAGIVQVDAPFPVPPFLFVGNVVFQSLMNVACVDSGRSWIRLAGRSDSGRRV